MLVISGRDSMPFTENGRNRRIKNRLDVTCHAAVDSAVDSTTTPAFGDAETELRCKHLNVQIDERIAALPNLRKIAKQRSASHSSYAASSWLCGTIQAHQTLAHSAIPVCPGFMSDSRCG